LFPNSYVRAGSTGNPYSRLGGRATPIDLVDRAHFDAPQWMDHPKLAARPAMFEPLPNPQACTVRKRRAHVSMGYST
jgi:hypothetical protein